MQKKMLYLCPSVCVCFFHSNRARYLSADVGKTIAPLQTESVTFVANVGFIR